VGGKYPDGQDLWSGVTLNSIKKETERKNAAGWTGLGKHAVDDESMKRTPDHLSL